jgi:hypothetical protein
MFFCHIFLQINYIVNLKINKLKKSTINSNSRTSFFVLGIFLLVWSVNGYFIGGELLKYALLFLGFGLIVGTTLFSLPKDSSFFRFCSVSFIILTVYWFVAILLNQATTQTTIILFDIVCYFLLISGYLTAKNLNYFTQVNYKTIVFIIVLTIFGCVMYVKYQSMLSADYTLAHTRDVVEEGDESGINVIGVSYTNAIIFFIIYYFLSFFELKKNIKIGLLLSLMLTFFLILYTQSRGALIYLILILILDNLKKINTVTKVLKYTLVTFILLFLLSIFTIKIIEINPVIGDKLQGTLDRFQLFLDVTDDIKADPSTYQRALFIDELTNDIDNIIFFGQEEYRPYPHNQFIEIVMRWGFFLGLPLIWVSISSMFKSLKIIMKDLVLNPTVNLMVILFLFSFFQSLSSMSLEMNRLFWLSLGFVLALPSLKNKSTKNLIIIE